MVERVYMTMDFVFNGSTTHRFAKFGFDFWEEVFGCFKVSGDDLVLFGGFFIFASSL